MCESTKNQASKQDLSFKRLILLTNVMGNKTNMYVFTLLLG